MKKHLLLAAGVAAIGISSLGAVGLASAQTNNDTSNNMVDKIATKFGLKKADVQAVFDENRAANKAEMQKKLADKLAEGVKAGTITQAQSDAITAKLKEMQADREANRDKFKSMTKDERKAAMEAKKAEMDKWIADNKIPDEFVRSLLKDGHRGPGGPESMGKMNDSSKPSSTDSN